LKANRAWANIQHLERGTGGTMITILQPRLAFGAAAALLSLSIQGCSAMHTNASEGFNTQQSVEEANRRLLSDNPIGSKLSDVTARLEEIGFSCEPQGSPAPTYQASILCSLSVTREPAGTTLTGPIAPNTWLVGLDSADGTTLGRLKASRLP
jgi:hypothetical protein